MDWFDLADKFNKPRQKMGKFNFADQFNQPRQEMCQFDAGKWQTARIPAAHMSCPKISLSLTPNSFSIPGGMIWVKNWV